MSARPVETAAWAAAGSPDGEDSSARPGARSGATARDAPHPPLRGAGGRAVQPGEDPRLPPSLHRRGGRRRRRDAGAHAGRRDRRHVPRARPGARARAARRIADGGDVRQGERLQPRPRRLHALLRRRRGASTAGTRSSAADCRSRSGSRSRTSSSSELRVTACFFGDGAVAEGEFHESLNLAALWQLPVLFLCENNLYAMGTPIAQELAQTRHPSARRELRDSRPGRRRDGASSTSRRPRVSPRKRSAGPAGRASSSCVRTAIRAHSMADPDLYRAKEEIEHWKERDPIALFEARLRERAPAHGRRPRGARVPDRGRARRGRRRSPKPGRWSRRRT